MILARGSKHHVRQFIFMARRHSDNVGHRTQVGNVKEAVVRGTVIGGKASAIHAERHRQILQSHIVDDAIVGALEERGVNRDNRPEIHGGHAGGKYHRVLFGNANIEIPVGQFVPQMFQAGTTGHGGGDAHELVVAPAKLHHLAAKNILPVGRGARLGRGSFAGLSIVRAESVKFLRLLQCGVVAFAFFREHMQHHGMIAVLCVLKALHHQREVMSVQWSEIANTKLLENHTAGRAAAAVYQHRRFMAKRAARDLGLERAFRAVAQAYGKVSFRQLLHQFRQVIMQPVVAGVGDNFIEVLRDGTDVFVDAPLVIIEDADEFLGGV